MELPALVYSLNGVLLLVALTALVAIALLSVRERLHDFGILKTVGRTPRQVASTLVSPFAVLAGVAGVVSVPVGLGLFVVVYAASGGEGDPVLARVATRSPAVQALRAE